ncbi:MAG: DUF805 domain-containing protein [Alphaproteobacteria bacterium]|nr:DUF805 domain-containing protein [Alphaproteobacteria bacterium]
MKKTNNITFYQAIKNFWIGYVDFRGRTTRKEYWLTSLFLLILLLATAVLSLNLAACVSIICMLPATTMLWRRFRDTGISMWWIGLALVFGATIAILPELLMNKVAINCLIYGECHIYNLRLYTFISYLTKYHLEVVLGNLPGLIIILLPSKKR